ncbi:MAG: NAD(P)/FAD-dependent oxidoreductase, partial [Oligoflexales bacterium]|nr:NAD(P)/FAD-dependent oxidoreductase [Oligoflexales bacterium]
MIRCSTPKLLPNYPQIQRKTQIFFRYLLSIFIAFSSISSASSNASTQTVYDAVIIGAGWSGLTAARFLKKSGLDKILILEKRESLGGVFRFSEDPSVIRVANITELSSSKHLTEISDYPYPQQLADFPTHGQIADYLNSYAQEMNIDQYIEYNVTVEHAVKEGKNWLLTVRDNDSSSTNKVLSRKILVATGLNAKALPVAEQFQQYEDEHPNSLILANEIKVVSNYTERLRGKKVLFVGGGETTFDLMTHLLPAIINGGGKAAVSIRNGAHFLKKRGRPANNNPNPFVNNKVTAYDSPMTGLTAMISPPEKQKPGMASVCKMTTTGDVTSYCGHGIPEWYTSAPVFTKFLSKSADLLPLVEDRTILAKGEVKSIKGRRFSFQEGGDFEADFLILSPGYAADLAFLPKEHRNYFDAYNFVFDIDDPSLAFTGFVRPVIGSIPINSELANRWIAGVWADALSLPNKAAMRQDHKSYQSFLQNYFSHTSGRIKTLVEPGLHADRILRHILTEDKIERAKQKFGFFNSLKLVYLAQSGARKLHLVLDDESTIDEFNQLWEDTGKNWGHSAWFRSVGINAYLAVARILHFDVLNSKMGDAIYWAQLNSPALTEVSIKKCRLGYDDPCNMGLFSTL